MSNKIFTSLAGVACLVFTTGSLFGQATRTWVSGVGDDANPGSRTAPCKTFAGAISKTQAGGEISVLDPGGFGAVTITKSITINGTGTLASIQANGANGIIINAGVTDVVTIRNISIKSPGAGVTVPSGYHGIKVLRVGELHVVDCMIQDGTDKGISFEPTNSGAKLFVTNTTIINCANGGIKVTPTTSGTVDITSSSVQGCKSGVRGEAGTKMSITGSEISGCSGAGLVAAGTCEINATKCVISNNSSTGVNSGVGAAGSTIRLTGCTIANNTAQGLTNGVGSQIISLGDNMVLGNSPDGSPTSTVAPK